MITKLLIDMEESQNNIKEITCDLSLERTKNIYKLQNIINKINYSTEKQKYDCRICGTKFTIINLNIYKKLNNIQLKNLINSINNYLEETDDYGIPITTFYLILMCVVIVLIPIYIAVYNMYIIQIFTNVILIFLLYPILYFTYQYQSCIVHDNNIEKYYFTDCIKVLIKGITKKKGKNIHIWSCKYANQLANYIYSQSKILLDNNNQENL